MFVVRKVPFSEGTYMVPEAPEAPEAPDARFLGTGYWIRANCARDFFYFFLAPHRGL